MHGLRRILVALLLLAFGAGTTLHAVEAGAMAPGAMAGSAADMPMPDDCEACGDGGMATVSACVTGCLGMPAVLPQSTASAIASAAAFDPLPERRIAGSTGKPDPHPPKPGVLASAG